MRHRPLTILNRDGHALAARLDLPPDGEPLAYALFAHCFTCTKNLRAAGAISQALVAEGLGVLRFDFTGLGQSEGDFADTSVSTNVTDLLDAAAFLEEEHAAPALLVGHSLGGAAVLLAAPHLPSVRAVATLGAPADLSHVTHLFDGALPEILAEGEARVHLEGRPFTVKTAFLADLAAHRLEPVLASLKRALLVLHAPADRIVGIDHAARLYAMARHPKSFVSLDDADHLLSEPADAAYAGRVIAAWAGRYLGLAQPDVKHPAADDNVVVARIERERFRTDVLANGFSLVADEPASVGGANLGPTPYDFLGVALATCTAMTLRLYADGKGWPLEATTVEVRHQRVHQADCAACADEAPRMDQFARRLVLEGALDDAQRRRLLEIAGRCPVHRTLEEGRIAITTTLGEPS